MASEGYPTGWCESYGENGGVCPRRLAIENRLNVASNELYKLEEKRIKRIPLIFKTLILESTKIDPELGAVRNHVAELDAILTIYCNDPCMVERAEELAFFKLQSNGENPIN